MKHDPVVLQAKVEGDIVSFTCPKCGVMVTEVPEDSHVVCDGEHVGPGVEEQ
jgi:hypothetical protein